MLAFTVAASTSILAYPSSFCSHVVEVSLTPAERLELQVSALSVSAATIMEGGVDAAGWLQRLKQEGLAEVSSQPLFDYLSFYFRVFEGLPFAVLFIDAESTAEALFGDAVAQCKGDSSSHPISEPEFFHYFAGRDFLLEIFDGSDSRGLSPEQTRFSRALARVRKIASSAHILIRTFDSAPNSSVTSGIGSALRIPHKPR